MTTLLVFAAVIVLTSVAVYVGTVIERRAHRRRFGRIHYHQEHIE